MDARFIQAASVEIGDTIRVHYPASDGVIREYVGTVFRRDYQGSDRVYTTAEGGELLRWNPARKPPRVTLLNKATKPETMLDMFESEGRL